MEAQKTPFLSAIVDSAGIWKFWKAVLQPWRESSIHENMNMRQQMPQYFSDKIQVELYQFSDTPLLSDGENSTRIGFCEVAPYNLATCIAERDIPFSMQICIPR